MTHPGSYVIIASNPTDLDPHCVLQRELVTSFAAQSNLFEHDCFLRPACCGIYSANVTTAQAWKMMEDLFSNAKSGANVLSLLGHGKAESGDFVLGDGFLSFGMVYESWRKHHSLSSKQEAKLVLMIDTCHSGAWVDQISKIQPLPTDLFIQASVDASEKSAALGFTRHWVRGFSGAQFDFNAIMRQYRQTPRAYGAAFENNGLLDMRLLFGGNVVSIDPPMKVTSETVSPRKRSRSNDPTKEQDIPIQEKEAKAFVGSLLEENQKLKREIALRGPLPPPPPPLRLEGASVEEKLNHLLQKITEAIFCPICHEVSSVPRIIECGHNVCEPCLKAWDTSCNPSSSSSLENSPQLYTNRKCPICRHPLVGPGYKCFGLRGISTMMLKSSLEEYDADTNQQKVLIDMRIKYLKQVEMGEFAAQQLALLLTRDQQMQGVLVFFYPTSTHAFLQSFGTYLVRVHQYDVAYDIGGRAMTVRLLLQSIVVVRAPLGSGESRLAPQLVVSSAPPIVNNADLYRYGIQIMPDRRIVILPAPPLSASSSPPAAPHPKEEDDDGNGDVTTNEKKTSAYQAPPSAPSIPIVDIIQTGPIPTPVDTNEASALLSNVRTTSSDE